MHVIKLEHDITKNFNETIGEFLVAQVYIFETEKSPYFFIRSSINDKKYRISISFEYLNKKQGLNIGIIRDFSKINLNKPELEKFLQKFILEQEITQDDKNNILRISSYKNTVDLESTQIFLIEKIFDGIPSQTIVFFSKNYPNLNSYLSI